MARLMARYYDRFLASMERGGLGAWRAELLAGLSGRVLEVGAGTGLNLPHYPEGLERLVLSEPDRHMRRKLEEKLDPGRVIDLSEGSLDGLPFDDGSFEAVVGTLVLCSVRDPVRALGEIARVLAPGGRYVFVEHVAADGAGLRFAQRCLQPFWRCVAGNCHLTRPTLDLIEAAGFRLEQVERDPLPRAVRFVAPAIRGLARRP